MLLSLHLYLTGVEVNVGVFGAVAAVCGGHQRCRVRTAAVKLHSAGSATGGAGCHVSVLSCRLNSVETCSAAVHPGEVPIVCPTVHLNR